MWVYTRADLARRGSRLALGTGTSLADAQRDERMKGVLAAVGLPAAILLHSITAWIFGLQIARGFWYSAIMAPLFIASALVSGTGLMIVLALIVRRTGRISFKDGLISISGHARRLRRGGGVSRLLRDADRSLPRGRLRGRPCQAALDRPVCGFFWFEVIVGLVIPFVLLAVPRLRADVRWVAVASALTVVGILIHRVNIVLNGLSYATVRIRLGSLSGRRSRRA